MARFSFLIATIWLLAVCAASAQTAFLSAQWPNTDFSKATVDLSEIRSGGPGKDGIPAVDKPTFLVASDERRIGAREPVLTVEISGQRARAYPIRYFMVHEIVNDVIGGVPIAVTFCPLCNSGVVFDRRVAGRPLSFGVSGNLRNSDMVMYDRQTESWWQQAVGEGIVGHFAGRTLRQIPSWMESWVDYRMRNPDGLVLNAPRQNFNYGTNPYVNYDTSARPFLYDGELPPNGIDPMARVIRVGTRAWSLERLRREKRIRENGVELTWQGDQASALDSRQIGNGRSVGAVRVRDAQGRDVVHDVMFAFAFHAFYPKGTWH
ncbi:DUF3179 domain-containing protein [Litoreibacter janthinus]|uniref:DUF3179 domain-containing protein n=1 Tax=Litoreibacter janthinus TaxID=670154 RepID=A0A1I6H1F5_9RHOB|nr:DUF3179 domain-containing protein [Litoreibacter janthinus]SFR48273.1 Protein of unknown function [Litoreibacter janthinus]